MNIAVVYEYGLNDYGKAEDFIQRGVDGFEAQNGKDHKDTMKAVMQLSQCLKKSGNVEKLAELKVSYPWLSLTS